MTTNGAGPLVAVIGLGGVGSHCAHALVRAGVKRLRLVDFDRVSLSSLNRHAVATRCDVGIPKVVACAAHFKDIAPDASIDARDEMFTASSASDLLCGSEGNGAEDDRPAVVVDCIDDVPTKVDLLCACLDRGLHVLSALGSGAKGDPTQLCVAHGLQDIENDPLATKLRSIFRTRGRDVSSVSFVYSAEKPSKALLPLSAEQRAAPAEFGNVANFRLRVIPVLGTQPALAGVALATQTLAEMTSSPPFYPRPTVQPRRALADKLLDQLRKREAARAGGRSAPVDVTVSEAAFLLNEVWCGRSALDNKLSMSGASGKRFTFIRWDLDRPMTVGNVILATEDAAETHTGPGAVEPELRKRIETLLKWAEVQLALPEGDSEHAACGSSDAGQHAEAVFSASDQSGQPQLLARISKTTEEELLIAEQLSRSESFLGPNGHARVRGAFVVVVGAGAVGSAAASLLVRAGVQRLRLVDHALFSNEAMHAIAKASDRGLPKVRACHRQFQAIMPCCHVEAVERQFSPEAAAEILAVSSDGRMPDLVLDCVSSTTCKAHVIRESLNRGLPVVTAIAPLGLRDPTRLSIAPLSEVYASPAAVALRLAVGESLDLSRVDAVHSQEQCQWVCEQEESLMQLSIGLGAAAVALHRLAGEAVPQPAPPGAMSVWKKLDRGLRHRMRTSVPPATVNIDVHAIGCITEHLWRSRSALSRSALNGPLCLTRWDRSQPADFSNLVLLTEEEADEHDKATAETCSLPRDVLQELANPAGDTTGDSITQRRMRLHRVLMQLQRHLKKEQFRCRSRLEKPLSRTSPGVAHVLVAVTHVPWILFMQLCAKFRASWHATLSSKSKVCGFIASCVGGLIPVLVSFQNRFAGRHSSVQTVADSSFSTAVGAGFAGLVGRTPLVELPSLSLATGCRIVAKAEFMSPGGCQKDRVAHQIILEAESQGLLRPGATIVEGTSGSTGISLTLAAAARGYRTHIVMPDDQAAEKIALLRRFGAEVELVRPAAITSPDQYVNVARRRAAELNEVLGGPGAFFANQFESPANFKAHFTNTGPELWKQCDHNLDAFVMSAGTGGTIAGVGRYLKDQRKELQVYLADVPGSSLYSKVASGVLYANEQAERTVRRHRTDTIAEGIGLDRLTANFARGLCEHNGGVHVIDGAVRVSDQEALEMAHYLLAHEGLFVGSSAAVNMVGACKVARKLGPGHTVASILCDSGMRHLTKFWNAEVWPEFGLSAPETRSRGDLSFVD